LRRRRLARIDVSDDTDVAEVLEHGWRGRGSSLAAVLLNEGQGTAGQGRFPAPAAEWSPYDSQRRATHPRGGKETIGEMNVGGKETGVTIREKGVRAGYSRQAGESGGVVMVLTPGAGVRCELRPARATSPSLSGNGAYVR